MYTKHRHELRHARKAWPRTLIDPCLVSGYNTEAEGRRETALHGVQPSFAIRGWAGRCDIEFELYCDAPYIPPSLTDRARFWVRHGSKGWRGSMVQWQAQVQVLPRSGRQDEELHEE